MDFHLNKKERCLILANGSVNGVRNRRIDLCRLVLCVINNIHCETKGNYWEESS